MSLALSPLVASPSCLSCLRSVNWGCVEHGPQSSCLSISGVALVWVLMCPLSSYRGFPVDLPCVCSTVPLVHYPHPLAPQLPPHSRSLLFPSAVVTFVLSVPCPCPMPYPPAISQRPHSNVDTTQSFPLIPLDGHSLTLEPCGTRWYLSLLAYMLP